MKAIKIFVVYAVFSTCVVVSNSLPQRFSVGGKISSAVKNPVASAAQGVPYQVKDTRVSDFSAITNVPEEVSFSGAAGSSLGIAAVAGAEGTQGPEVAGESQAETASDFQPGTAGGTIEYHTSAGVPRSDTIESGLQVEGKAHSVGGVDLKVVRENRKLELRVNMPQERIQVIDVRSDIYWVDQ